MTPVKNATLSLPEISRGKQMTNNQSKPEFFENNALRLIIFGGKGGVGKTTMAAAAALQLAGSYNNDKKVLIISTDPAHSLSDSFDLPIGDEITPIKCSPKSKVQSAKCKTRGPKLEVQSPKSKVQGRKAASGREGPTPRRVGRGQTSEERDQSAIGNRQSAIQTLFALELDASKLLEAFKRKNDGVMKKLADRGTYFDQQDVAEFFDLSLPGMDEVMAIIEIANLLKKNTYDVLILDTAPTGHTVRMLNLPEQMRKWIEVMDLMQQKHRYMATHFTGRKYVKDECDIFLDNLSSDIDRVKKLLSNVKTTRFVPVTIPEPMGISETKRLLSSLEKMHVPVKEIIVNRVAESDGCVFCLAKMADQKGPMAEIEEVFSKYDLIKVALFPNEVRGVEGLKGLADYLLGVGKPVRPPEIIHTNEAPQTHLALSPDLEFILFGGKGGVGKTSLAAAVALHLAKKSPEKKVLVFSTDPAHSLSDSFRIDIGDKITPVQMAEGGGRRAVGGGRRAEGSGQWAVDRGQTSEDRGRRSGERVGGDYEKKSAIGNRQSAIQGNLFALEINADELFEDFKQEFKDDIEEVFDRFLGKGVDIKFDREVMTELLTLAPPGLDEIMALDRIMELREKGEFDLFVLDTSPTGHLLRFLELPDMVREWLKAFFRLLLKYKGVVRLTRAAERALTMSKNIRRIQETLVNPQRTEFVAVTIAEAMGLLELERLVGALDKAKIPCNHVVINMVVPETDCAFCSSKRAEQQGYIGKIRSRFPTRTITGVPQFANEVRGISDLDKMGGIIFDAGDA